MDKPTQPDECTPIYSQNDVNNLLDKIASKFQNRKLHGTPVGGRDWYSKEVLKFKNVKMIVEYKVIILNNKNEEIADKVFTDETKALEYAEKTCIDNDVDVGVVSTINKCYYNNVWWFKYKELKKRITYENGTI